jgi:hypothetical protein
MVFAMRPEIFDGVQFRCVGRQVLDQQPASLVTDELLGESATMGWQTIPHQQEVARNVAQQMLEELNHLFGTDGFLKDLEIEIPEGQASDKG